MSKQEYNYPKLSALAFIFLFACGQGASASDFKLSPFALYEQGKEDIYIKGIRTKYGLGVVGVAVETKVGKYFNIRSRLGYGYHPNADVSLTVQSRQVAVTGPVEGTYLEGAANYLLWSKLDYSVTSEVRFVSRDVKASDLVGTAGSRAITGTAVNKFDTLDLLLSSQFPVGERALFAVNAGMSRWNLKTSATAYAQTGGSGSLSCPCSYTKKIDTTSIDPVGGISVSSRNPRHNFDLELYSRSLKSKAGTQIIGVEMEYKFNF
jgi:hypothetical protein